MRPRLAIVAVAAATLIAGGGPAAVAVPDAVAKTGAAPAHESRLGGGGAFRRRFPTRTRRPTIGRRRAVPRRPISGRRVFRGILRALGFAFLLHLLFGWGSGGSPFGLFIVLAFVVWLATHRRRRTAYRY